MAQCSAVVTHNHPHHHHHHNHPHEHNHPLTTEQEILATILHFTPDTDNLLFPVHRFRDPATPVPLFIRNQSDCTVLLRVGTTNNERYTAQTQFYVLLGNEEVLIFLVRVNEIRRGRWRLTDERVEEYRVQAMLIMVVEPEFEQNRLQYWEDTLSGKRGDYFERYWHCTVQPIGLLETIAEIGPNGEEEEDEEMMMGMDEMEMEQLQLEAESETLSYLAAVETYFESTAATVTVESDYSEQTERSGSTFAAVFRLLLTVLGTLKRFTMSRCGCSCGCFSLSSTGKQEVDIEAGRSTSVVAETEPIKAKTDGTAAGTGTETVAVQQPPAAEPGSLRPFLDGRSYHYQHQHNHNNQAAAPEDQIEEIISASSSASATAAATARMESLERRRRRRPALANSDSTDTLFMENYWARRVNNAAKVGNDGGSNVFTAVRRYLLSRFG